MASPPQQGQCDRVAPVAFVHRVRHDRPKEAHPDEYAALERYSESGQEEQFWAVVTRSRHQHHDNSAILFFLEYKTCEFKCVHHATALYRCDLFGAIIVMLFNNHN